MARQCLGAGVRDGVPVLIAPHSPGDGGGCSATWAGAGAGPDASAAPCAAGGKTLPAPSAKPFRLTGHRP